MRTPWNRRVAVVTGAASGIGLATARALVDRGCRRVHLADIDAEGLARAVQSLGGDEERVVAHRLDFGVESEVASFAECVLGGGGAPHVVVNNAGIAFAGAIEDTTLADWKRVLSINLFGVIHGIDAFVRPMLDRGEGHIVNISSGLGLFGFPQLAVYCASKFAVVGLSESLNIELGDRGVRVTAVCPGIISTNIVQATPFQGATAALRDATARFYARRGADPSVVAKAVVRCIGRDVAIVPVPGHVWPGWLLRRVSQRGYQALVRVVKRRVLG